MRLSIPSPSKIMSSPLDHASSIIRTLHAHGHDAYIVGGYVRDRILGIATKDIDIATSAPPSAVAQIFGGDIMPKYGTRYGTSLIRSGDDYFETTTYRRETGSDGRRSPESIVFETSIAVDAARRDFTCNALYYDPTTDTVVDPLGGEDDLHHGILRWIGDPAERIQEDPVRILRYVRILHQYGFTGAKDDHLDIVRQHIGLLPRIAVERIRAELERILLLPHASDAMRDLQSIGFWKVCMPEVERLVETAGGPRHHLEGTVWVHTCMVIDALHRMGEKNSLLFWTGLLHDIAKPDTISWGPDGRVHYHGHDTLGARQADAIMRRYRFGVAERKTIVSLIREHIRIFDLPDMSALRARRFMLKPYFEQLLHFNHADSTGKIPSAEDSYRQIEKLYVNFLEIYDKKTFLTGKDIIARYSGLSGKAISDKLRTENTRILMEDLHDKKHSKKIPCSEEPTDR